ncbi:transposase [Aureimonas pseudogalii]|uniref:Transposase n=1 Tax=Aureimonas pseudogalii TaxID=1744844 RepID=A0A7W6H987_9HYPH|nr:transposase [Aureimonas pseudogalii]
MLEGGHAAVQADEDVVGTSRVRDLEKRVRDLERLLGRKTMENEILKEALDVARPKKRISPLLSWSDPTDGSR